MPRLARPFGNLTARGAQRLRDVRDHIITHPETFDWGTWCGTRCCIAGHLLLQAGQQSLNTNLTGRVAAELLGFSCTYPCADLFYGFPFVTLGLTDAQVAVNRIDSAAAALAINQFLLRYGHPVDIAVPVVSEEQELCCV